MNNKLEILENNYMSTMEKVRNKHLDKMKDLKESLLTLNEDLENIDKNERKFIYNIKNNLKLKYEKDIQELKKVISQYDEIIKERTEEVPEKNKILYLEKRGCDFFDSDKDLIKESDVGNYRICTYDYSIRGKDGNHYLLSFGNWDRTPMGQKKTFKNLLVVNPHFETPDGCYRRVDIERQINEYILENELKYTLENILKVVNMISKDEYVKIEFI